MKTHKAIIPAMAAVIVFAAGVVSAQTTTVSGSFTPNTNQLTPGTGVTLGTLNFSGTGSVASLPITFSAANGGVISNLSNCGIYNASGTSIAGSMNPSASGGSFTFSPALTVNQTGAGGPFTLRCDIATSTTVGSTFGVTLGSPVLVTGLRASLDTAPTVPAGSQNVALANILFDMSGNTGAINVSSIPVTVIAGNGGSLSNLSDCHIRPSIAGSASLTNLVSIGGAQTFAFTSPYLAGAGTQSSLALACNVAANTPVGSTFTISINPSAIGATNVGSGSTATVNAGNSTSGSVMVTAIVTDGTGGTGGTGGTDTSAPGIPNTGLGTTGLMTLGVLLLSALVAIGGTTLLRRAQ